MARNPVVSICLPVYNGERHVGDAIRSILTQTFEDIELIISDNASTDGTLEICHAAAAKDSRVRYSRAEVNRGLAWNYNQSFALATGRYLLWVAHDDMIAPDHIKRCVEVLQQDSAAVLCFTNAEYIGLNGDLVRRLELANPGASETRSERFRQILWDLRCDPICGLMKVEFLKRTRLYGAYADSDRVLLAELALQGRFRHLPDYLFSRRIHALQTTTKYVDRWDRTLIFDPGKAGRAICPWWTEAIALLTAIGRARPHWEERTTCYKYLYWWCLAHRGFLALDVTRGMKSITRRVLRRPVGTNQPSVETPAIGDEATISSRPQIVRAMGIELVVRDPHKEDAGTDRMNPLDRT